MRFMIKIPLKQEGRGLSSFAKQILGVHATLGQEAEI
jgi:hypothetical protein